MIESGVFFNFQQYRTDRYRYRYCERITLSTVKFPETSIVIVTFTA